MAKKREMPQIKKPEIESFLKTVYYDISKPASFSTPSVLYRYVKHFFPEVTMRLIKSWLNSQHTYLMHKQSRIPKKRRWAKFVVSNKDLWWDCDVAMFGPNKKLPSLICTDSFSGYIRAQPLRHVTANNINSAFKKLVDSQNNGIYPMNVRSDAGPEFARLQQALPDGSNYVKAMLRRKAFNAENAIRKIRSKLERYKTFTGKKSAWPEDKDEILKSINNTPLSNVKIDLSPADVTSRNAGILFDAKYGSYLDEVERGKQSPLFRKNQPVRITLERGPFAKGSAKRYTDEVFFISDYQENTVPLKYFVADKDKARVPVSFYNWQLIAAEPNFEKYKRVQRVLQQETDPKTKKRTFKVSFVGLPGTAWVSENKLKQFKGDFD